MALGVIFCNKKSSPGGTGKLESRITPETFISVLILYHFLIGNAETLTMPIKYSMNQYVDASKMKETIHTPTIKKGPTWLC